MIRSEELEEDRQEANASLASIGISLRIECRGRRLNLRGPLPGRENPEKRSVQRLSLGLEISRDGLLEAEQIARVIDSQLKRDQFRWDQWIAPAVKKTAGSKSSGITSALLDQQLQTFEKDFFADPRRRRSPSGSRTTWTGAYNPYLRRLRTLAGEDAGAISAELLLKTLHSYPDGSRSRQQCSTALACLARHLDLALPEDWRAEAAGYGLHRARFRQLPSDHQILESILRIPNPRWRLAYGLMATYGLRNHEVFFSDLSALCRGGDRVIRVLPTTKTGEHQVWPFNPDWVERFDLLRLGTEPDALPVISTDLSKTTLQQVGRRVSEQFRRYELPLTPYDLRHAWAVRTIHIGLPDTVSARMMGHSVAIHTRTYHHWITRRDQQQAVDAALARQHA